MMLMYECHALCHPPSHLINYCPEALISELITTICGTEQSQIQLRSSEINGTERYITIITRKSYEQITTRPSKPARGILK